MTGHVVGALPEFVLGLLRPEEDASVRDHLAACAGCGRARGEAEEALGLLASGRGLEPPRAALRAQLLDEVSGLAPYRGFARRVALLFDVAEPRALAMLSSLDGPAGWETYLPGARVLFVEPGPAVVGAMTAFVRFEAGLRYPDHLHLGNEHMLVLGGCFADDVSGRVSLPGDSALMGPGSAHSLTIGTDEPCVCAVRIHGGAPVLREGPVGLADVAAGRDV